MKVTDDEILEASRKAADIAAKAAGPYSASSERDAQRSSIAIGNAAANTAAALVIQQLEHAKHDGTVAPSSPREALEK